MSCVIGEVVLAGIPPVRLPRVPGLAFPDLRRVVVMLPMA
jgi:hypothetical protein